MTAGATVQAYRKGWWTPSDSELVRTNNVKLPLVVRLLTLLPKSLNAYLTTMATDDPKRKLPEDKQDILGLSPYSWSKLNEDIWSVQYEYDSMSGFSLLKDKPIPAKIGLDVFNKDLVPQCLASPRPGTDRDELEKDFQQYFEFLDRFLVDKSPPEDKEDRKLWWEMMRAVKYGSVVKLKSGGILLYDPPRMRPELVDWLTASLGEVKYIICPSSQHTMFLKGITDTFPNARLIASNMAMQKMRNKGYTKPAECEYTNQDELRTENELLASEGIELIYINGDAMTSALALYHKPSKSLLNCDINYAPSDTSMKGTKSRVVNAFFRLGSMNGSDLPKYRVIGMDHTAGLCNCSLGDCADMAASLRELVALDFVTAYGSHQFKVEGNRFKSGIDDMWGWLDGKSLLS